MSSHQSSFQAAPHLNSDLRLALSILYNLPQPISLAHERPTSSQAHEYLLQFQSRNARRRLQSQAKSQQAPSQSSTDLTPNLTASDVGSTWLSCVFLVSSLAGSIIGDPDDNSNPQQQHLAVHYAEALFAAQTMFHRLRRVKLSEAIDVEFEPTSCGAATFPPSPQYILEMYRRWILQSCRHCSALCQLIHEYHPLSSIANQMNNAIDIEERIKGEISMLVLANALNELTKAFEQRRSHHQSTVPSAAGVFQERPLLTTLSLALTTVAARMRYIPSFLPHPAPDTQPIVNMILGSVSMIQSRQQQQNPSDLYYVCLMAVPDAVLQQAGVAGGAYGRFSLEHRCFAALTSELKTEGMVRVWQCLQEIESHNNINPSNGSTSPILILQLLESWAKHVPLPSQVVEQSIPWILQSWQLELSQEGAHLTSTAESKTAMAYWIAIMESGALTLDQVLLSSLVQSREKFNQPSKKRQSSKSRRRENQILEERATDDLLAVAKEEVRHRGEIACSVAKATWPAVVELLRRELHQIAVTWNAQACDEERFDDDDIEGCGPVGAVTACATACLPHMLRESHNAFDPQFFASISEAIQRICASPSRTVRNFAAESIYTLHEMLTSSMASLELLQVSGAFDTLVAHFFHCAMNLACGCGYPDGYFNDLAKSSDDDLENERNDVRDLLRTVTTVPSITAVDASPIGITLGTSVLLDIVKSCAAPIQEAADSNVLFPETSLHAFSALAKPVNACATWFSQHQMQNGVEEKVNNILWLALNVSSSAGSIIIRHFAVASMKDILPLSRLFNLALASLSPMLSALVDLPTFQKDVIHLLAVGIEASGTSLFRLPELTGPSSLRSSRLDIRGAMRSPGGEDHAGVLTLLRLADESDSLSRAILRTKDSVVLDLCSLYEELKRMEMQRGAGVFHGIGVLPKSRRILMGIICHLEAVSGGEAGALQKLSAMFDSLLSTLASFSNQLDCPSPENLYQICETVFDAGAFSSSFVHTLFDVQAEASLQASCLHVLHESGIVGFKVLDGMHVSHETIHQWNRLRAALFTLLMRSDSVDVPSGIVPVLTSWIRTECEATVRQCSFGPTSSSPIFHEEVLSEECVPPGLFLQILANKLSSMARRKSAPLPTELQNTVAILSEIRQCVLEAITSPCGCPVGKGSFHDPRPVIAETWLSCMHSLCVYVTTIQLVGFETFGDDFPTAVRELLLDTFVAVVILLLYCSLEKTQDLRSKDPGMALDGPQGLVMMEFLEAYFRMGSAMLQEAGQRLITRVPVDASSGTTDTPESAGVAIVGAVLFRGSQGALPPWAVESVPAVYCALFGALDRNVDHFVSLLDVSMSLRLAEHHTFGSVQGGALVSGIYFETMKDAAKSAFLHQAREFAAANNASSWKRLKSLIKTACGGKKKDTDFNQRPALTKWDALDRL